MCKKDNFYSAAVNSYYSLGFPGIRLWSVVFRQNTFLSTNAIHYPRFVLFFLGISTPESVHFSFTLNQNTKCESWVKTSRLPSCTNSHQIPGCLIFPMVWLTQVTSSLHRWLAIVLGSKGKSFFTGHRKRGISMKQSRSHIFRKAVKKLAVENKVLPHTWCTVIRKDCLPPALSS